MELTLEFNLLTITHTGTIYLFLFSVKLDDGPSNELQRRDFIGTGKVFSFFSLKWNLSLVLTTLLKMPFPSHSLPTNLSERKWNARTHLVKIRAQIYIFLFYGT